MQEFLYKLLSDHIELYNQLVIIFAIFFIIFIISFIVSVRYKSYDVLSEFAKNLGIATSLVVIILSCVFTMAAFYYKVQFEKIAQHDDLTTRIAIVDERDVNLKEAFYDGLRLDDQNYEKVSKAEIVFVDLPRIEVNVFLIDRGNQVEIQQKETADFDSYSVTISKSEFNHYLK